jgi:hypothetical protein
VVRHRDPSWRRVSPRFNEPEEVAKMPSTSSKQRKFMGMQLGKKRSGQPTDVAMSEQQLSDFASKPKSKKKLPPKPKSKFERMDDSDAMV